jgi:hypothetical protein
MTIKNKDGSTYQHYMATPKLMEMQNIWNEKVFLHNKFGIRHIEPNNEEYLDEREVFEMPKPEPVKEEVVEPVKEEIKVVETIKQPKPKYVNESIVDVLCLPCVGIKEGVPEYGNQLTFKAKLLRTEDLFVQILCKENVPPQSIIYPQINMKRWWRVTGAVEKSGFYIVSGMITDYQPSFS